jgi:PHD/YefM family antitoxin component YafN of YafNO toxin-antitoxin module
MPQKLVLKENQTVYNVSVEENDLTRQPIILKQNNREVAAIIPIEKYRAFQAWEKQLDKPLLTYPEFEAEKAAFERLESSLIATHRGKYVAIRGGQVVDSDEDKLTLIARVYDTRGYGPMYVHKVGEPLRVAKIISPRIVR